MLLNFLQPILTLSATGGGGLQFAAETRQLRHSWVGAWRSSPLTGTARVKSTLGPAPALAPPPGAQQPSNGASRHAFRVRGTEGGALIFDISDIGNWEFSNSPIARGGPGDVSTRLEYRNRLSGPFRGVRAA